MATTRGPKARPAIERFSLKVSKGESPDSCWLWTGATTVGGYGIFAIIPKRGGGGYHTTAHRFAFSHFTGPIPDGYEIDHLCENRLCVNPAHLEAVTQRENNRRSESLSARNIRKTACPIGHPYSEHGYVNPNTGRRRCRTCGNEQSRTYYKEHRGKAR